MQEDIYGEDLTAGTAIQPEVRTARFACVTQHRICAVCGCVCQPAEQLQHFMLQEAERPAASAADDASQPGPSSNWVCCSLPPL